MSYIFLLYCFFFFIFNVNGIVKLFAPACFVFIMICMPFHHCMSFDPCVFTHYAIYPIFGLSSIFLRHFELCLECRIKFNLWGWISRAMTRKLMQKCTHVILILSFEYLQNLKTLASYLLSHRNIVQTHHACYQKEIFKGQFGHARCSNVARFNAHSTWWFSCLYAHVSVCTILKPE